MNEPLRVHPSMEKTVSKGGSEQLPLEEPEFRYENVGTILSKSVESHTVVSCLVLLFGIVTDASLSLEPTLLEADTPSSLRCSSLVAILAFASPAIRDRTLVDQRIVLGVLIVGLALTGLNIGSAGSRTGEVIFVTLVGLSSVVVYQRGGIEADTFRPDAKEFLNAPHRRRTMSSLAAGLMIYLGARCVRYGFTYADIGVSRTMKFSVGNISVTTPAHAFVSAENAIPLCAGGVVAVGAGLVSGSHRSAHLTGTSVVAFQVGFAGIAIAVAALFSMLSYGDAIDSLPSLYSKSACLADSELCADAMAARRFNTANGSSAILWTLALGHIVYSFAVEHRLMNDRQTTADLLWKRQGFTIGVLCYLGASYAVWRRLTFDGQFWHTDVCALLTLVGIFVSSHADTFSGTGLYVGAMVYEEYTLVDAHGSASVYMHLTHVTHLIMLVMMVLHFLFTAIKDTFYSCFSTRLMKTANISIAVVGTFGASLAFGLYIASVILISNSNGALPGDAIRDQGGRTMIAFALQHFFPVFAWAPVYSARAEVNVLNTYIRAIAWLSAVPIVAVVYVSVLFRMDISAPSLDAMYFTCASAASISGFIAWGAASVV